MLRALLSHKTVILASKSPRRKQLLQELDIDFVVQKAGSDDEHYPATLFREQIPLFLSKQKADSFKDIDKKTIVIAADTIVLYGMKVLEKPRGREEAIATLQMLSGNIHEVITGVCIKTYEETHQFHDSTNVFFKDLSEEEIVYYVDRYQPYDKAGAYGIQEWIGHIGIHHIEGSYFNVMGLPISKLYEMLKIIANE